MILGNKTITYACLAGGVFSLVLSLMLGVTSSTFLLIAFSALCFSLTLALHKYGYLLLPMLTSKLGFWEKRGEYEIPPSQEAIVKKCSGVYYATVFLQANILDSDSTNCTQAFEKMVSSLKFPAKYATMVFVKDLGEYRQEIVSRRTQAEIKLGKLKASAGKEVAETAKLEREIELWNDTLKKLGEGQKPMDVVSYLMTTATGASVQQAIAKALAQANELKSVACNALNVEVQLLKSDAMKLCLEWEEFLPASAQELREQVF